MSIEDLTKKQKEFVKEYIDTGNGTQSALKVYDTDSPRVAASIAHENLTKPDIINAIQDSLPDTLLAEKHLQLLNSTTVEHMVFPINQPSDDEIREMLDEVNCKVKKIVHGETARHVYFWAFDNKGIKDALDMAYKLKGSYAPAKHDVKQEMVDGLTDEEKNKLKELVK